MGGLCPVPEREGPIEINELMPNTVLAVAYGTSTHNCSPEPAAWSSSGSGAEAEWDTGATEKCNPLGMEREEVGKNFFWRLLAFSYCNKMPGIIYLKRENIYSGSSL